LPAGVPRRAQFRPAGAHRRRMWMGCNAISTFLIVAFDPWNTVKALTWLSGSTYGRTPEQLLPVGVALLVLTPLIVLARRELDLLALDDDTQIGRASCRERVEIAGVAGG